MKKFIISFIIISLFSKNIYGQADVHMENRIGLQFFSSWIYFRMMKTPLLSYEETHNGREWKRPDKLLLPPEFTSDHLADIKIRGWYDQKYNWMDHFISFPDTEGMYIIEKEDGITGIKWEYFTSKNGPIPIDSIHVSVYDSIFPFDNRFLVFIPDDGEICFFSGNVLWDDFRKLNSDNDLESVAYIRGVQFGMQQLKGMPDEWIGSIRENLPEYQDWDFAFAEKSFLTYGRLLITAPPNKAEDYLEFMFFSDHPQKTGDKAGVFYEFRYMLPTNIKTISERRLEKRKLTPEEVQKIKGTDLIHFIDMWRVFTEWYDEE